MDEQFLRDLLAPLSAARGGSLIFEQEKLPLDEHVRALFLGLGGLGCKTVNAAKAAYQKRYRDAGHVRFLAVDSDRHELEVLTETGCLSPSETVCLYSPNAAVPRESPWLSEDRPAVAIDGRGALGIRQLGRLMLLSGDHYRMLRNVILDSLRSLRTREMGEEHICVFVCTGLFGGTGSGILLDVCYMVQLLLNEQMGSIRSDVFGVFYTPEVLLSDPEFARNPALRHVVKSNAYAAMKELDYFMSADVDAPADEPVYTLALDGENVYSRRPPLNPHHAFLISGGNAVPDRDQLLRHTAEGLLSLLLTGHQRPYYGSLTRLQTLMNRYGQFSTWKEINVGRPDVEGEEDSTERRCAFPSFMHYHFASLGFRSFRFPRNEMAAYCANRAFAPVHAQWRNAPEHIDYDAVCDTAKTLGIDNPELIFRRALAAMNLDPQLRIMPGDSAYPIRKGFEYLGRMFNLHETIDASQKRVQALLQELKESGADPAGALADQLAKALSQPLEVEHSFGPYGKMVLLHGSPCQNGGLCGLLAQMTDVLPQWLSQEQKKMDYVHTVMLNEATRLAADRNPHDAEIEYFIDLCEQSANAAFEFYFCRDYMPDILRSLQDAAQENSRQTCERQIPILETLSSVLQEDSSVAAASLPGAVRDVLDSIADAVPADVIAGALFHSFYNASSVWAAPEHNPAGLCHEIRNVFAPVIDPLCRSHVPEQLMVLAHCSEAQIVNAIGHARPFKFEDLQPLWDDPNLPGIALRQIAEKVMDSLEHSPLIGLSIHPQEANLLPSTVSAVLLPETPELNREIEDRLNLAYGDTKRFDTITLSALPISRYQPEVLMAKSVLPLPLAMIVPMREYAAEYFSDLRSHSGERLFALHADRRWVDLPEIYGSQAEEWFYQRHGVPRLQP